MSSATWTTKDGKQIPISEMTTEHIINALELMKRKGRLLMDELKCRKHSGFSSKQIDKMFKEIVRGHLRELQQDSWGD